MSHNTHRTNLQTLAEITVKFDALFSKSEPEVSLAPIAAPDSEIIPDIVRVHNCRYPEIKKCRCRKKVLYAEAIDMIEHGEASWVQLVVPVGPAKEVREAISLNTHDRVTRASVPGALTTEVVAETGLAKLRNRTPDIGDVDSASERDADKERDILIRTEGKSIGGRIQKTTRTRLSNDGRRLVEETTASFDESITRMTGNTGGEGKALDKTGGQKPISDDYSEESMS